MSTQINSTRICNVTKRPCSHAHPCANDATQSGAELFHIMSKMPEGREEKSEPEVDGQEEKLVR